MTQFLQVYKHNKAMETEPVGTREYIEANYTVTRAKAHKVQHSAAAKRQRSQLAKPLQLLRLCMFAVHWLASS